MNELKYIGIIPARYASTRFPGKPLAMLGDKTMIERVYRRVSEVLDEVVVATDDERILRAVEAFGGCAVMTSPNHRSGTDRCLEAYDRVGARADVVINIQGDEPFIDPSQIRDVMGCFRHEETRIATLVRPFDPARPYAELENPNTPKVTVGTDGNALLFSRSVIPYVRGRERSEWPSATQFYTHIGLYAYRIDTLREITALPQSQLELAESLEQLRWLQNGYSIRVAVNSSPTIGIDTPANLEAACKLLNANDNA